jgi:hypothetical protein
MNFIYLARTETVLGFKHWWHMYDEAKGCWEATACKFQSAFWQQTGDCIQPIPDALDPIGLWGPDVDILVDTDRAIVFGLIIMLTWNSRVT